LIDALGLSRKPDGNQLNLRLTNLIRVVHRMAKSGEQKTEEVVMKPTSPVPAVTSVYSSSLLKMNTPKDYFVRLNFAGTFE